MPDEPLRSANILADDVATKIATDGAFRQKIVDDPQGAAEAVKQLADPAINKADASGAVNIQQKEADTKQAQANTDLAAATADKLVYIIAVAALGAVAVLVVGAIYVIAAPQVETLTQAIVKSAAGDPDKLAAAKVAFSVPDGLIALGSAAIGALAGLLGPLSQRKG